MTSQSKYSIGDNELTSLLSTNKPDIMQCNPLLHIVYKISLRTENDYLGKKYFCIDIIVENENMCSQNFHFPQCFK